MSISSLTTLVDLSDMLYHAERAKLEHLLSQESRLRGDIARVDAVRQTSFDLPADSLNGLRRVGADVQWQAWLGRKRAGLNQELALVLAQKDRLMARLRRAHGRKQASDKMRDVALEKIQMTHRSQEFNETQTLTILQEFRNHTLK